MKVTFEWEPSDIKMGMIVRRPDAQTIVGYYIIGYRIPSLKEKELGMTSLADGLWITLSEKNDLNVVINHFNAFRFEPVSEFIDLLSDQD